MTRGQILRMARESGFVFDTHPYQADMLEHFAALVAAAEREECAKVCEQIDTAAIGGNRPAPNDCAAAIRSKT